MKKSLIALAALATVGAAQAQSNVTIYGGIDAGYSSLKQTSDAGVVTKTDSVKNSESYSSRIGFRGTEDLGGGLKANFIAESGIGANENFVFGSRLLWAGVQGGFGEVRIGRQATGAREVFLAFDQLAAANVAGNLAHSTANGGPVLSSHADFATGVQYITPRVNGLQANASLNRNRITSGTSQTDNGSGYSVGGSYVAGKFGFGVSYAESKSYDNFAAPTSTGILASSTCTGGVSSNLGLGLSGCLGNADTDTKRKTTAVGASYNLGFATVGYIYNRIDQTDALGSAAGVTSTNVNNANQIDRTSHALSVSVPVNKQLTLRAGYGMGKVKTGTSGTSTGVAFADAHNGDIRGHQLAANYNLSARTMAYAIYGAEERETTATAKSKASEYSVGIRHLF